MDERTDENEAAESRRLDDEAAAEAATQASIAGATVADLQAEIAKVDAMLAVADQDRNRPDARVRLLNEWIPDKLAPNGSWNSRGLILFTEWEATRHWLRRHLIEALADLDSEDRIVDFAGATTSDRREALKQAFDADPADHRHDLIHIDLPWNPSRLEQRNRRIDRKLQPSPKVWCRYFVFGQREEDLVLKVLVEKAQRIRRQAGSAGQVIGERIVRTPGIRRHHASAGAGGFSGNRRLPSWKWK